MRSMVNASPIDCTKGWLGNDSGFHLLCISLQLLRCDGHTSLHSGRVLEVFFFVRTGESKREQSGRYQILLAGFCGTLERLFQHEHVGKEMKYVCVTCRCAKNESRSND